MAIKKVRIAPPVEQHFSPIAVSGIDGFGQARVAIAVAHVRVCLEPQQLLDRRLFPGVDGVAQRRLSIAVERIGVGSNA